MYSLEPYLFKGGRVLVRNPIVLQPCYFFSVRSLTESNGSNATLGLCRGLEMSQQHQVFYPCHGHDVRGERYCCRTPGRTAKSRRRLCQREAARRARTRST